MKSKTQDEEQRPLLEEMFNSITHFRFYALRQYHLVEELMELERKYTHHEVRKLPNAKNIEEALLFDDDEGIVPLVREFLEGRYNYLDEQYEGVETKRFYHHDWSIYFEKKSSHRARIRHIIESEKYGKEAEEIAAKRRGFFDLIMALDSGLDTYLSVYSAKLAEKKILF